MPVMQASVPGTVVAPQESLLARYAGRSSQDLKSLTITVYGPSGIGKSRRFLQLSKHYPVNDEVKHTGPLTLADDVFVVSYDKGGMISGLPIGLDVPRVSVMDVCYENGTDVTDKEGNTRRRPMSIQKFHRTILFPMLAELYAAGVRVFGLDTLTSMMALATPEFTAQHTNQDGVLDGMKYYPALTNFANELFMNVSAFPGATVVFLGHSKFKEDFVIPNKKEGETPESAKAKLELKKETIDPYLSKIILDMPGKTAEPFMNQSSLVLAIDLTLNPKTRKYEREFVVNPGESEHRAKNRLDHWLNPREPANLRGVINKIQERAGLV